MKKQFLTDKMPPGYKTLHDPSRKSGVMSKIRKFADGFSSDEAVPGDPFVPSRKKRRLESVDGIGALETMSSTQKDAAATQSQRTKKYPPRQIQTYEQSPIWWDPIRDTQMKLENTQGDLTEDKSDLRSASYGRSQSVVLGEMDDLFDPSGGIELNDHSASEEQESSFGPCNEVEVQCTWGGYVSETEVEAETDQGEPRRRSSDDWMIDEGVQTTQGLVLRPS